jgi:transposase
MAVTLDQWFDVPRSARESRLRCVFTSTGYVITASSKLAARRHVGQLLDINPATLRNWIEAEKRAGAPADGSGSGDSVDMAEVRRLRAEVAELRRANEILKTASEMGGAGAAASRRHQRMLLQQNQVSDEVSRLPVAPGPPRAWTAWIRWFMPIGDPLDRARNAAASAAALMPVPDLSNRTASPGHSRVTFERCGSCFVCWFLGCSCRGRPA